MDLSSLDVDELAKVDINGRQIKNTLQLALALARHENVAWSDGGIIRSRDGVGDGDCQEETISTTKVHPKVAEVAWNKNNNDNNGSATNRQNAPVKVSTTLNTTPTYEPPSPSNIVAAPMIKTSNAATTSSASTSESSVSPGSPKIVDPGRLEKSSPTKSLSSSKRGTVRDVIQAKKSPIKVAPAYSQAVVDWGKFPVSHKDDIPFDEQTALSKDYGAFLFYADATSNGDIEVDMIYDDLEQRRKKERKTDRIPTQVTVETPITPSPARPVDPVPVKLDSVDLSFESEADHPDSSLQWVVLSDGTLEMRENPDQKEKRAIVAPQRGPLSTSQPRGSPRKAVVSSADEEQFKDREVKRVKNEDQEVKRVKNAKQEDKREKNAGQEVKQVKDADKEVKRMKDADQGVKGVNNVDQDVRERRTFSEPSDLPKVTTQLVQERKKVDPPAADEARMDVSAQEATRKIIEQEVNEKTVLTRSAKKMPSMDQPTVQEEKKEQEDGDPCVPLVPKILVQSRTTSPALLSTQLLCGA
ncbi:hypothetical protein MHU86_25389 [Fragilaria crotonensis]|nr:hypothetical protein MHU86_25389 [Fragilaria crotonensis]